MAGKEVVPALKLESFSCPHPHCGALAHQSWFKCFAKAFEKDNGPWFPSVEELDHLKNDPALKNTLGFLDRLIAKEVFFEESQQWINVDLEIINVSLSKCYSCGSLAIWHADELIYPASKVSVPPDVGMPADVKMVFLEANEIVDKSPRGAAALLRLCIQKLMPHLGEKGLNINDDIASLVQKGLDARIQKALDVVRVVGNNAVHPGQINLDDNKKIASNLFGLVNVIVESQITQKKHIDEMFEAVVPESAKTQIEKRDAPKQIGPPGKNA